MKKGFTLVELLAVIVILGMIFFLIIPNVMHSFEDAKKETYLTSTKNLVNSLSEYYARVSINNDFTSCTYDFTSEINTCSDFGFSGKKPDMGSITIDDVGNVNGYVKFTDYLFLIENNIVSDYNLAIDIGKKYVFDYTGSEQSLTIEEDGYYKLEVWGAQGGSYSDEYYGGYGGYSSGIIYLKKDIELFITVGGKGQVAKNNQVSGGYNGGGVAITSSQNDYAGSGGGATHIALKSGLLSELSNDTSDVLIVAGGGGGAYYYSLFKSSGGSGGGYNGGIAPSGTCSSRTLSLGYSANQTVGGGSNYCLDNITNDLITISGYGYGASGISWQSGGGAGYYGGGSGFAHGANGGSGYIGNSLLMNKLMYCYNCDESNADNTLTISTNNVSYDPISNYAKMGSGYVKITYIGPSIVTEQQSEFDFAYTGKIESIEIDKTGIYKLEVWGAQGGNVNGETGIGGYGGYSKGIIKLSKNDKLYVVVGGAGQSSDNLQTDLRVNGGYNGGGYAYQKNNDVYAAGGGGATHIALKSGLLSELSEDINDILLVAGGGAGAYRYPHGLWNGNSGGGYIGGYLNDSDLAGTQSGGYSFGEASDTNLVYPTDTNHSGAGSGFYGGHYYWDGNAGGGSGYIGNSLLMNKLMYCYNCDESNDDNTLTISTNNVSYDPISNYAKMGNGYAKITYLGID